jgi:Na+-transporting NADH:ubiquinone oxidoreductase subunit B
MKFLHTAFQNIKAPFEKGGKFEKYDKALTAIDAFETLMFTPDEVTHTGAHIRDGIDLKRTMSTVILAMVPCLLFGMYNAGFQHYRELGELATASFGDMFLIGLIKVLPIVVISYGVGLGIEFAFAMYKGHSVEEGFLVTGMLIPLIVPVDIPLWMLAIAVAFAVVFGKEVFGGTGMNILNVALTARAFLFFAYPTFMSGDKIWVHGGLENDAVSGATILGDLAGMKEGLGALRDFMTPDNMFMGYIPGSIGETSTVAILIGAAILILTGIGSWRIMLSAVAGGAVMGLIFNQFDANGLMEFPWWQHMMVGGFAFGVVFMATDPVTAAQTNTGKWIYGFFIGILAIMIRVFNPAYPEGIMLAILFMNVMAPLIDHYVVEANIKRRLKRLTVKAA